MRARKALINAVTSLIYQFVTIVCGLILPRLILSNFGSGYNGLTSSISQFISCISLMKAGLFGVSRSALYKPLAENDSEKINSIVRTTELFLRKIALIFAVCLVVFSMIYPIFVSEEFEYWFTVTLFLIIGVSTFFQYYFGMAYSILLEADQRQYVVMVLNIITTLINTFLAVFLIKNGCEIRMVKAVSAVAFSIYPILQMVYAKRHYHINKNVKPDNQLIAQRWDAFAQEIAFFVHNNTDIIFLTIFTNTRIVSVYTVYNYVVSNLLRILETFVAGFGAAFGNMLAKKEYETIQNNLKVYEVIVFSLSAVLYSTAAVMIVPFAMLYTKGVTDINYAQPLFGILISFAGMFSCFRIPYKTIVDAAGHFKRMRNGAILEAVINITVSIILVLQWGLIGVAIGTVIATIFRSVQYAVYLAKELVPRSQWVFVRHVLINIVIVISTYILSYYVVIEIDGWIGWVANAIKTVLISSILMSIFNMFFFKNETREVLNKVTVVFRRKKHEYN